MNDRPRVLIVEDEGIIAQCLAAVLEELGYAVPAAATTGEAAIESAAAVRPDVVLMDIMLRGTLDGVTAARRIQAEQDVPVVYLTALADDDTARRTGIAETFGIVRKPFDERDLLANIEIARYRHAQARSAVGLMDHFTRTLGRLADAAIAVDAQGRVAGLNPAAETLTGWNTDAARGHPGSSVLGVSDADLAPGRDRRVAIVRRDGTRVPGLRFQSAEVRDREGKAKGTVLIMR